MPLPQVIKHFLRLSVVALLFLCVVSSFALGSQEKYPTSWFEQASQSFQFIDDLPNDSEQQVSPPCGGDLKDKEQGFVPCEQSILANAETASSISCSAKNFDLFFALFAEDPLFQAVSTVFPLKYSVISYSNKADSGSETKIRYLKKPNISTLFIFPNRIQRQTDNLRYQFEYDFNEVGQNVIVHLTLEDAGYNSSFRFLFDGCWKLVEVVANNI